MFIIGVEFIFLYSTDSETSISMRLNAFDCTINTGNVREFVMKEDL